jgi:hypothetical protein
MAGQTAAEISPELVGNGSAGKQKSTGAGDVTGELAKPLAGNPEASGAMYRMNAPVAPASVEGNSSMSENSGNGGVRDSQEDAGRIRVGNGWPVDAIAAGVEILAKRNAGAGNDDERKAL